MPLLQVTNTLPSHPTHNTPVLWEPALGGVQPWWVLPRGRDLKSTRIRGRTPGSGSALLFLLRDVGQIISLSLFPQL